ncbi:MAG: baseplate J/gp47 family protein [Prevotella sp.]|nr:baseplate J/gp47 family protein [Prevotella sp.]
MDFTNLYNFKADNGIIVPEDSEVLLGIQQKFQEIFGADIDLSAETPVGRLIEAFAVVVKTTLGITAQSANQFNINEATGIYLDALAEIFNIRRIAETKTQIKVRCYFSDNASGTATIPAGSLIMAPSIGAIFSIDKAIQNSADTTDESGRYYADGTATATQGGAIYVAPAAVNTIQTSVLGWSGVRNLETIHVGTDLETDEALRTRIKSSRNISGGFVDGLLSGIRRVPGVYSACVIENNTGTDMYKQGVPIPPHSLFVSVDCIETDSLLQQIATIIARDKPIGVGMVNESVDGGSLISRTINYGYDSGSEQTVYFYKAQKTAIRCDINFSASNYSVIDLSKQIFSAVNDYLTEVGVGGTVRSSQLSTYLANKLGIAINSLWIYKDGSSIPADVAIEMNGYEVPFSGAAYINLTQKM